MGRRGKRSKRRQSGSKKDIVPSSPPAAPEHAVVTPVVSPSLVDNAPGLISHQHSHSLITESKGEVAMPQESKGEEEKFQSNGNVAPSQKGVQNDGFTSETANGSNGQNATRSHSDVRGKPSKVFTLDFAVPMEFGATMKKILQVLRENSRVRLRSAKQLERGGLLLVFKSAKAKDYAKKALLSSEWVTSRLRQQFMKTKKTYQVLLMGVSDEAYGELSNLKDVAKVVKQRQRKVIVFYESLETAKCAVKEGVFVGLEWYAAMPYAYKARVSCRNCGSLSHKRCDTTVCWKCNRQGHVQADCDAKVEECLYCGEAHAAMACPQLREIRSEATKKKRQSYADVFKDVAKKKTRPVDVPVLGTIDDEKDTNVRKDIEVKVDTSTRVSNEDDKDSMKVCTAEQESMHIFKKAIRRITAFTESSGRKPAKWAFNGVERLNQIGFRDHPFFLLQMDDKQRVATFVPKDLNNGHCPTKQDVDTILDHLHKFGFEYEGLLYEIGKNTIKFRIAKEDSDAFGTMVKYRGVQNAWMLTYGDKFDLTT